MSADSDRVAGSGRVTTRSARRLRLIGPWLALAVVLVVSLSFVAVRSAPDMSPTARAQRLSHEIKCPACQGLSVAESRDPSSAAIRADVKDRIDAGQSDGDIRRAYVRLYGESILLKPEGGGLGVLVWGLPVAVVVAGALGIAFALRRSRPGARQVASGRRRVLVLGGIVALAAAAGVTLAIVAGDRTPERSTSEPSGPSRDDRRAALARAVDERPDDYATRIAYARFLVNDGGSFRLEAIRQFDAAAALDTSQAEPNAYAGWLLGLSAKDATREKERAALVDAALERIDRSIEIDAEYPDSYVFKGLVLFEVQGDPESAIPWLQRYLQIAPQDDPMREVVLGALARAVEQSPTTATPRSQSTPQTTTPPTT